MDNAKGNDAIKDLSAEVFFKLTDFLETIDSDPKDPSKDPAMDAAIRLRRFIPDMDAIQQAEIYGIIKSKSRSGFDEFKAKYPDLKVDPKGRSEPSPSKAWEFRIKSLDAAYAMAKASLNGSGGKDTSKFKAHTQVIDAKELGPIERMSASKPKFPEFYDDKRFIESGIVPNADRSTLSGLKAALAPSVPGINRFMRTFEEFCLGRKKENCALFADHVMSRLEILGEDAGHTDPQNKAFADLINKIFPPEE